MRIYALLCLHMCSAVALTSLTISCVYSCFVFCNDVYPNQLTIEHHDYACSSAIEKIKARPGLEWCGVYGLMVILTKVVLKLSSALTTAVCLD